MYFSIWRQIIVILYHLQMLHNGVVEKSTQNHSEMSVSASNHVLVDYKPFLIVFILHSNV